MLDNEYQAVTAERELQVPPLAPSQAEQADEDVEDEDADAEKDLASLSLLDQTYKLLSEVPFSKDEVSKGLGSDCWEWMTKLTYLI